MTQTNFVKIKPLFGLDIGHGSFKVMQVDTSHAKPRIVGYGNANFDPTAVNDGVIMQPEVIAKAIHNLFNNQLIGDITTNRVALAIPSYRSYARSMQLPKLKPGELTEAVNLEIEQYTPVPFSELYTDYRITNTGEDTCDVFAVAIQHEIVDSYLQLTRLLGLEPVLVETTMAAAARLFSRDKQADVASVIIDFGSLSSDVSIYHDDVVVTGTVPSGGLVFTRSIAKKLGVSESEAATIKNRYGLAKSKKQSEIVTALEPSLSQLAREIRRMIRYYEDRYGSKEPVGQIIALGGGANVPGLSEYMTSEMRMPVRTYDPWNYLDSHRLQLPSLADHPMFATVAGLSLADPREVFKS
jgi:type IV pilus assembly protein PilM